MDIQRRELQTYLLIVVLFVVLIGLLRWEESGQLLFDRERYFFELPDNYLVPKLDVRLRPLGEGELEVILDTSDYAFSEVCTWDEKASTRFVQGHAHLYVDGKKVQSLYAPYAVLRNLPAGRHRITVSLNVLPDHRALTIGGQPLAVERDVLLL